MSLNIINDVVKETLYNNIGSNNGSLIRNIHEDILVKYNSVNVLCGKQSSGKTVLALQEIIKMGVVSSHHLFVYITKEGRETDRTFISLKPLILIPYVIISESEAVDYIKTLLSAKQLYYTIRNEHLEDKIEDEQLNDMFEMLHINNFNNEYLHTVILFDDISNNKLFNSEETYFSQLIRRCRHVNITVFLLIQGWKGLKPHVKNEISTLFIFPCFNKQQLHFIYSQSARNLSFDEFYNMYREIVKCKNSLADKDNLVSGTHRSFALCDKNKDSHGYMMVNVIDGGDTMICPG